MIEEKVIQQENSTSVETSAAQIPAPTPPVPSTPPAPDYQGQLASLEKRALEAEERAEEMQKAFENAKSKIGEYYEDRKKSLEDQGMYKPLWEEANQTAQEKDKEINALKDELSQLRQTNEQELTKNSALAAISDAGAINADQTLALIQSKLKKNDSGQVVVLDKGVEQDLGSYITNLRNPGSGWEHHFKPSNSTGMGAKPTPTSNIAPGRENPWKTGNLTQQMIISDQEPELAAVLQREASQ
mgnify:CR=1 FL=1